jgi:hypothetical protein
MALGCREMQHAQAIPIEGKNGPWIAILFEKTLYSTFQPK